MACKTFHKGKYYISIKRGFEDCKKDVTITIDKVFETDTLKISLSDDEDPAFLCVLIITRTDYEDLKKQQGLLVDFDNFPSQLVRLLQQCASNNMFLIMQQKNPMQYYFEVVEHNEFKRLVHLSLKTGPATDAEIKQHMSETIIHLKKTLSSIKSSANSTEAILNDKCMNLERKIHDYTHNIARMEEEKNKLEKEYKESLRQERDKMMQEKQMWQQNAELNMKSQLASYQDNLNKKDKQIDEINSLCKQLRDNISHLENQLSEKSQCLNMLEKEVQKTHIEVATLKAKTASLERDCMEKDKLYNQANSKCVYLEKTVKDNGDLIRELNSTIHLLKKEKLLCRTAIALEQEKVIERNTKEMEELKLQICDTNLSMEKLQKEFDDLRGKYEINEKALKERDETIKNNNMVIQWLHKKMDHLEPPDTYKPKEKLGIPAATSSTPYFLSRNNNHSDSLHGISEESIDFYATSKSRSNLEESPGPETQEKNTKVGLDPKYLQPAEIENKVTSGKGTTNKHYNQPSQKGKENINLPKVDYREKKSARSSTYRTTPVSAYFP
ncbi:spindle assembly abnormal protein 6 homolog isoform X3 [Anticarsia gemmatalis]|uniref:spindle assembly abnormal protein 6 homolog isoform X3 n=1 Tax=Anticarsia gemmatalis TaxID=129554 RepID=UPI003F75C074